MLLKPYRGAKVEHISQFFHFGHQALDWVAPYGTPIVAPERCRVSKVWGNGFTPGDDRPFHVGFGVHLRGLDTGRKYIYWHFLPYLPVDADDLVERGQIVGFMGNSGYVTVDGVTPSVEARVAHPYPGTHIHTSVHYSDGRAINPFGEYDFDEEPAYTRFEWCTAWMKALKHALFAVS